MKTKNQAEKTLQKNVRWQALKIIDKVEHENDYSNVLIDRFLNQSPLSEVDNRLLVQLVYGVIQNRYALDYQLEILIQGKKIEKWVQSLLRLSAFQLFYLDRIPEHAIINEAVTIAKKNGHEKLGNFVNAILRSLQRQGQRNILTIDDPMERYSVLYSVQKWIVEVIFEANGQNHELTREILASLQLNPVVSARLVTQNGSREIILQSIAAEGFVVEEGNLSPDAIRCVNGNVVNSHAFEVGQLTIQDESSMLVAPLGQLKGNEQVLDACSAPGGKATHIASLLTMGKVTALDLSSAKLNKVMEHAQRMRLENRMEFFVTDASKFLPTSPDFYDIIYLDAPCSGLGLMRRKPEIKYQKTYEDVIALQQIQMELLNHMADLLIEEGKLIYSTCTLTREENELLIEAFLEAHPEFSISKIETNELWHSECLNSQGQIRIWPNQYHTDGFFICRLVKNKA